MIIFLINDDLEECVDTMHEVIQSQHNKSSNNVAFIEKNNRRSRRICEKENEYDTSILHRTDAGN